jgi:hypothetical protein
VDLEKALEQFDIVEANLRRLQNVLSEMGPLIPDGIAFTDGGPEGQRYRELQRSWQAIVQELPPIGAYQIESTPLGLDEIARDRMEAEEVAQSRFESIVSFGDSLDAPRRGIEEYEARLIQMRRELVRDHLMRLMGVIDGMLKRIVGRVGPVRDGRDDQEWDDLEDSFGQVERLTGSIVPGKARWSDMRRHLLFGQSVDLHDIVGTDWPSVRAEIEANLYSELEPLPVVVDNLLTLVQAKPSGPVTTKLNWPAITAEEFERLLFNIVADASDYTNPQWLTHTNAPDRGRDISVERVSRDTLSGTKNQRVIVQAKHWQSKSIRPGDVSEALTQMAFWEPPRVHVLIVATSGRFTADAVSWVEKHNDAGKQPVIEMWPDSHLELLLAQRPHLVAGFKLR